MTIKETLKIFFTKIASMLGLRLQQKSDINIKYTDTGLNPTAIGATVIANIAIDDSDLLITGENSRADAIRDIAEYYVDSIQQMAAEVSLGTGDCIVRPYTDGKYIGLNVIGNDDFVVTDSIGQQLRGVIMRLDEYKDKNDTYRLFESQILQDFHDNGTVVSIKRFAYRNDSEINLDMTNWSCIVPSETIVADQLLLGRYKCPTINRENYNSANGVPITFGCDKIIDQVKEKYKQYNDEFERKQALIFADRSMFKKEKDDDGDYKLRLGGAHFVKARGAIDGGIHSMIQEYSPNVRETEFKAGSDFNLSVLEMCCGFSRGVFTTPETSFATATEMKNSLKKTFSFVKTFRRRLEHGDKMLFHAIDIIMNVNRTTPIGDWNIQHEWSYDYIELTQEKFNQLLQSHSIGAVRTSDVTSWVLDMPKEEAEEYVAQIKTDEFSEESEFDSSFGDGIESGHVNA